MSTMRLAWMGWFRQGAVLAVTLGIVAACSSSGSGGGGGVPGYTHCSRDVDCPSGQACDEDDPNDSYCTPKCTTDSDCPIQVGCPGLNKLSGSCQEQKQLETTARSICDQFQGALGPNSCRAQAPSSSSSSSSSGGGCSGCTADSDCGHCQRCNRSSCTCVSKLTC